MFSVNYQGYYEQVRVDEQVWVQCIKGIIKGIITTD